MDTKCPSCRLDSKDVKMIPTTMSQVLGNSKLLEIAAQGAQATLLKCPSCRLILMYGN